jgi:hypothetical protein
MHRKLGGPTIDQRQYYALARIRNAAAPEHQLDHSGIDTVFKQPCRISVPTRTPAYWAAPGPSGVVMFGLYPGRRSHRRTAEYKMSAYEIIEPYADRIRHDFCGHRR